MPEYVYALHDFTPQVADEIEFKVGDRIEVVEKDDMYGDGWWQVSPLIPSFRPKSKCLCCRGKAGPFLVLRQS